MLNKKDNRSELSDEDILRGVDFSDNSKMPKRETEATSNSTGNDFVDSSLFVVDEFQENNNDKNRQAIVGKKSVSASAREEISPRREGKNEYFRDEILSNVGDEVITIKANKNDVPSRLKWKIMGFVLVLVVAGAGGYVFFTKKKEKSAFQPEEIKNETTAQGLLVKSLENISDETDMEKKEEAEEVKIDFLKMNIDVFNASGVAGAAGKIKDLLAEAQYENVEAKNYEKDMEGVMIFYKKEEYAVGAREIADILKKKNDKQEIKLSLSEDEIESEVAIILGK